MPTPPVKRSLGSDVKYFVHDKNGTVYGWLIAKKQAQSLADELRREGSKGKAILRSAAAEKVTDAVLEQHPHLLPAESFAFGVADLAKAVAMPPAARRVAPDVPPEIEDLPELGPEEGDLTDEEIAQMEAAADAATAAAEAARQPTVPGAPDGALVAEATPARATTVPGQPAPVPGRVVDETGKITAYTPPANAEPVAAAAAASPDAPAQPTEGDPTESVEDLLDEEDEGLAGLRM